MMRELETMTYRSKRCQKKFETLAAPFVVIVTPPSIPFNGEEMAHIDANNTSPD
jgi:hypothetical protein